MDKRDIHSRSENKLVDFLYTIAYNYLHKVLRDSEDGLFKRSFFEQLIQVSLGRFRVRKN